MPIRILIIAAIAAAIVCGCGRRGSLEEPPGAAPVAGREAAPAVVYGGEATLAPGSGTAADTLDATSPGAQDPELRSEPAPRRRFFLDFLL
ncbi:MAG TPA: hypothetical protein VGA77_04350 [Propylenella sp.]